MSIQKRINKAYLKAAYRNNLAEVKKALLETRFNFWGTALLPLADINTRDGKGRNALMLAASRGHMHMVTYLTEVRSQRVAIDPLAVDHEGNNALHYACVSGNVDVITYLLKQKLPINQANHKGVTPLMLAIQHGHGHLVEVLVEHGANVNTQDNDGDAPLHWAVNVHQLNALTKLVEKGAKLDQVNSLGNTALHLVLIKRAHTESSDTRRFCKEAAKLLIEKGTDLTISNNAGKKLCDDDFVSQIVSPPPSLGNIFAQLLGSSGNIPVETKTLEAQPISQSVTPEEGTPAQSKLREAFVNEGLDPDADEQWRPIGQSVIEHVIGNAGNPRVVMTTFNFTARQITSQTRNLLTAESLANTADAMDSHPNPAYVEQAHAELLKAGKTPPILWPRGMPIGAKKLQLSQKS